MWKFCFVLFCLQILPLNANLLQGPIKKILGVPYEHFVPVTHIERPIAIQGLIRIFRNYLRALVQSPSLGLEEMAIMLPTPWHISLFAKASYDVNFLYNPFAQICFVSGDIPS